MKRPQHTDIEENPHPKQADKPIPIEHSVGNAGGRSAVSDALFIAAVNPVASQSLVEAAGAVVPHDALAHTGSALGSMAVTAGHAIVDGSAALIHLAADAGSVALHALADMGESAVAFGASAGSSALHAMAEGGSAALGIAAEVGSALVQGGSAALGFASEVGGALMEHGGAALEYAGEAGAAVVAGAVAVGEMVASAVS